MGYGESWIISYRVFILKLNDDTMGVNCMFIEIILEYTDEYYNTINSLMIEMAKDEKNIESCIHLAGTSNTDNENQQLYQNTRITLYDALIVAYRTRVKSNGTIGNDEKSPIHIADVIETMGSKPSRHEAIEEIWSEKSKTADSDLITRGLLVTTSRTRGNIDPVVSETIAGYLRSGWSGENSKMLVPQVIYHATSNKQHTR